MKIKYLARDYEQRLHDGVVSYGGLPYLLQVVDNQIYLNDLVTGRIAYENVPVDHNDLDISSIRLGFINTNDGAVYMQRIPLRRYKQSLDQRAIIEHRLTSNGFRQDMPEGRSAYLKTKWFFNSFKNAYPTPAKAFQMLELYDSVALSREVAITRNSLGVINFWYKNDDNPVGWADYPRSSIIRIPTSDKAWIISNYLSEFGWEVD